MKKLVLLLVIIFLLTDFCYALDWQRLHNTADQTNLTAAQAAVKMRPDSIEDLYVLALVCLNDHKDNEAYDVFNRILQLQPETREARWGLAEVLRRRHDLAGSEEVAGELIKIDPGFAPAYITLAYIKYIQTDYVDSVKFAVKVLTMGEKNVDKSNHVRSHLLVSGGRGMLAYNGGLFAKLVNGRAILPNLRAAEKLQPDSAAVLFGLGTFFMLAPPIIGGDLDKAEDYLKLAVISDPLFADAYVRLGQLYLLKGDSEKYAQYLNKALEIDPQNELALDIKSGTCKFICAGKGR